MNGHGNSIIDEDCFLFTSESVGEGHPGMYNLTSVFLIVNTVKYVGNKYSLQTKTRQKVTNRDRGNEARCARAVRSRC